MKRAAPAAIILAAGKGTRMKTDIPKVMAEIGGRPLVRYVIDAAFEAGLRNIVVVVGYKRSMVATAIIDYPVVMAHQVEQRGTGHAVLVAAPNLAAQRGPVVVLAGDIPLIRGKTIASLLEHHGKTGAAVTVLTTNMPDPSGYGRIVRDASGRVTAIVEEKDATPEIRALHEINSSIYAFDWAFLVPALTRLRDENAQREYYLTDTVHMAVASGLRVEAILVADPREVAGVNTVEQLEELAAAARSMGIVNEEAGAAV